MVLGGLAGLILKTAKKSKQQIQDRSTLTKMVDDASGKQLTKEDLKTLVDSINDEPEKFAKAGAFDKAVNFFVSAYNKARFKKVPNDQKNTAYSGEKHQPLLLKNGSMTVARFSGPGTQIIRRIKEELAKNGGDISKIRGITPLDTIAGKHDLDYALAQNTDDIRKADELMVKRGNAVIAKKLENKYNSVGAKAIQAKISAEDIGILSKDKFASFTKLDDNTKKLLIASQQALAPEKVGFGKIKRNRKPSSWDIFLKKYKKDNPSLSLKEAMQGASKKYKN